MTFKDQRVVVPNMKNHMGMPNNKLKTQYRPLVLALQAALTTGFVSPSIPSWAAQTTRVSVNSAGVQGNFYNEHPSISADGRYVVFTSFAGNLVTGDSNNVSDIFVRDRLTNQTTRVSVSSAGTQGNLNSYKPTISADGRFVAFESLSNNLVPNDSNNRSDVFVRDRVGNQTTRVSVSNAGAQGNASSFNPSISSDGRFVAFSSFVENLVTGDTNGNEDVFIRDRTTNQTTRISVGSAGQGNNRSYRPSISSDGRFVSFTSHATNLVAGDTNGWVDVFVHDRTLKQTTRVSVSSAGVQGNFGGIYYHSISANGRFVVFQATATNLVPNDTNGTQNDVFIRDRTTNQTTIVSIDSNGVQGYYGSYLPSISADGRFVAFSSVSNKLVLGDTNGRADIFIRDRTTNQTARLSLSSAGVQGNEDSRWGPSINSDGRYVVFESDANNLVANDTNASRDIFVRDRLLTPAITADLVLSQTVSANPVTIGTNFSYTATVSNNGPSNAANLVLNDFAPLNGQVSLPTLLPSQGTCIRSPISICRLGTINVGQHATVKVTFTAIKQGTVGNRVTVNAAPKDPTPFNAVTTNTTINP